MIETTGPALVVVLEIESQAQIIEVVAGENEQVALSTWLSLSPMRAVVADAARVEQDSWARRDAARRPVE